MARSILIWLRAAAVAALATQALAQTCYYPNGNAAPNTEKPCSSAKGSACCPDTWQCLDNGLCYNPAAKINGRYSCTDKDWKAPGCASNLCTYGGIAAGAESLAQCSTHNNDWCCNGDDTNVKCCQEKPAPRPYFKLQDGKAYATIGKNQASSQPALAGITGLASGSGGGSSPTTKTDAPASSVPPASSAPPPASSAPPGPSASSASADAVSIPAPFSSVITSVSSGSAGVATIINTVLVTPTPDPTANTANAGNTNNSSSGSSGSKTGLIVGCAVGIPLALALVGIIAWILLKRRRSAGASKSSPEMDHESTSGDVFTGKSTTNEKYRQSRPGTTEIDSIPAGPGRPISQIPGHAELDSGAAFQAGHGSPYTPDTVGLGGGNGDGRSTWASAPPGYSPGMSQTGYSPAMSQNGFQASELDATSAMPVINEAPQQYQAYRPPPGVAELPSVKTPEELPERRY